MTKKILVLSDSHSALWFMKDCVNRVRPDAIVHLGDHYGDGEALQELFPHIPFWGVPGNCDQYRCPPGAQEILAVTLCGVKLYMTHGHRHHVKMGTGLLCQDARKAGAAAALYGHTHIPHCQKQEDGLWLLNPGAAGSGEKTAGLIETDGSNIIACRILGQAELEVLL